MFKNLFREIMMGIRPMIEDGSEDNIISFGSVKIDTTGMSEAQIESLGGVKDVYKNSTTASIENAKKVKEYEQKIQELSKGNPNPNEKKEPEELEAKFDAYMAKKFGEFEKVTESLYATNSKSQVTQLKKDLTEEFSMFGKENIDPVFEKADEFFEKLPVKERNPEMYKNFVKANISDVAKSNLTNFEVAKAEALVKNNPELMQKILKGYMEDNNIDINMPNIEGITNQGEYDTRMSELKKNFNKPSTTIDQKTQIAQEIENIKSQASKFGFKVN